ncbi:MAG: glycosyltransferase family 4 protein [Limisphaerales bacterium]
MNRKPALLMIAYTYYQSDPRVIREAEAAVCGGFEVDFFALRREREPGIEEIRGVRVHHLHQSRYRGKGRLRYLLSYLEFFVRCFFKATALFFKRRYRIIHVNNMPDFLVFSTLIPKLLGAKVVLDIHDPMPNTFASKFKSGERGFFYRVLLWQELLSVWYADRTLTVHEPVKEGVLLKHGLRPETIHTICNFADDELFRFRPDYAVNGKVHLAFHGTILERSGLRNLVLALGQVKHRDRIDVKIIGEGDFSEPLKQLIGSLGLRDVVHFDNRSFPVRDIPQQLTDCNLGLVPLEISSMTNYALPLKLLEYTSLGLPVVTVRSAAISYYFSEEDCLFYQWDDPASLAAVLDRIAGKPELLLPYRQKAVALRKKFLWGKEKLKYIMLLKELAGLKAPAPAQQASVEGA